MESSAVLVPPQEPTEHAAPRIAKLSHTHEAIARWLIANPTAPLSECAKEFQYTQAWLSCIIHSDAFQARLKRLQAEADAATVLDVPARLRGVAAAALDGLGVQVEHALKEGNGVIHRQFLHDTAELTLKALGYGSPKPPAAPAVHHHFTQNNVGVAPEVLARAREKIINGHAVEVSPALQETRQLPASRGSDLGQVQRLPAAIPAASGAEGAEAARSDLSSTSGGAPS